MAASRSEFHDWLCDRLKSLNLDEEVLGEYISGILDGDDSTHDEKQEALTDILEGMMETPDKSVCSDIFMKWKEFEVQKEKTKQEKENKKQDILAAVLKTQTQEGNDRSKHFSHKLDENLKKNLIAQYGHESDEDICSSSDEELQVLTSKPLDKDKEVFQNTNAKSVLDKEREKRDKQRQESEEKRVKNKEDREKQKAKAEQRKEKEKNRTQKGERRR